MKLTRGKRIALELLGPPAIGAGLIIAVFGGASLWDALMKGLTWDLLQQIGMLSLTIFCAAYLVVGIQSIIYAIILEWRFKRGLVPCSWQLVRLSSLLGFGSGAVLSLAHFGQPAKIGPTLLFAGGLGLIVGFLMGLLIKRWSTEKETTGEFPRE
jgi:hypothetical protein